MLAAFDLDGFLPGTTTTADEIGGKTISVSFLDIDSVEVSGTRGSVAFEDLTLYLQKTN